MSNKKFKVIGVRFNKNPQRIYTYKVRAGAKIYLGQKLIAESMFGFGVVFVVSLSQKIPEDYTLETLTEITEKVEDL